MKEAVRAAVAHTMLDASKEATELMQRGGIPLEEACKMVGKVLAELMIINALSGERVLNEDLKQRTLDDVSQMYDEFKKRMTQ